MRTKFAKDFKAPSGHTFRNIKFFNQEVYEAFKAKAAAKGSNITHEINVLVLDAMRKDKLPSEMAVILNKEEVV